MILLLLQKKDETPERHSRAGHQQAICPNCGSKALAASVSDHRWLDAILLFGGVASYQCRVCNRHFRSQGDFEVRLAANGLSVRARPSP